MRLWSIHPKYLDAAGLVAVWREGLLAQKVLSGKTKGYRGHPELNRFKASKNPMKAIGAYLVQIFLEGKRRGYKFNKGKIKFPSRARGKASASRLKSESIHLKNKLKRRDRQKYLELCKVRRIEPNPFFSKHS